MSTEERIPLQSVIDRKISPMGVDMRSPLEQITADIDKDIGQELLQKRALAKIAQYDEAAARSKANLAALTPAMPPNGYGQHMGGAPSQIPQDLPLRLAEMPPEEAERALDYYQRLLAAQAAGNNPAILPYVMGPKPNGHSEVEIVKNTSLLADMFKTGATMAKESVPQATQYNPVELMRMGVEMGRGVTPAAQPAKDAKAEMAEWLEVFDRLGFIKKGDDPGAMKGDTQALIELERMKQDRELRELDTREKYGVEHEKNRVELEKAQMYGNILEQVGGAIGRGFADANILGDEAPQVRGFPQQAQVQEPSFPPVDTPELWHRQCSDCAAKGVVTWIPIPNPSEPRASLTCPTCGASGPWPPESVTPPVQPPVPPKYPEYRYDPTRPIQ